MESGYREDLQVSNPFPFKYKQFFHSDNIIQNLSLIQAVRDVLLPFLSWTTVSFSMRQRCTYMSVESVGHELELSIRGDEGDGPVILKAGQSHTLVKLDILQLH